MNKNNYIYIILAFGATLRLAGISYGLPLWLVGDEPSLIFGALKMLELRTLLPALHAAEFSGTLYYTPYLPYLFLITFVPYIGALWTNFSGTFAEFRQLLVADVSGFFVIARIWSAAFGTLSIWYVYRLGQAWFKRELTALLSAIIFAVSFLPVSYSHLARHWMPVTCFFLIVMWYLSRQDWPLPRRFFYALLFAGLGVGVNVQVAYVGVFILLYLFLVEKIVIKKIIIARWFYASLGVFIALVALAYILWPRGFDFIFIRPLSTHTPLTEELTVEAADVPVIKTFSNWIAGYSFYVGNLARAEPFLAFFALIGLSLGVWHRHRLAFIVIIYSVLYITLFYFRFAIVDRYILVLYPLLALFAGYGLTASHDFIARKFAQRSARVARYSYIFVTAIIVLIALPAVRLDYLFIKNDTRIAASEWVKNNIPAGKKVAVLVPLMRLPATSSARKEMLDIDPSSLRAVDKAEEALESSVKKPIQWHVLNAYTISRPDFFLKLKEYLRERDYDYLVATPKYLAEKSGLDVRELGPEAKQPQLELKQVQSAVLPGQTVFSVSGSYNYSLTSGHQPIPDGYGAGWRELFLSKRLGPDILVQKL